ncbi:MAG: hypothetical protein JJ863_01785 [Deltaproteobacteria bacterium]|nr:hypothetical protein [Deltaproteobacteria bacterium]
MALEELCPPSAAAPENALRQTLLASSLLLAIAGCGDDDGDTSTVDATVPDDASAPADFGPGPMCSLPAMPTVDCMPLPTDYSPGADDMWAPCISDDGTYHRIEESISSIARIRAFEDIASLIFDPSGSPTSDDYLMARMLYQEDEGLDSRVARRYDPRFEVPDGTDCTQPAMAAEYPDYCVGPVTLQPTILDALNEGIENGGVLPAARAEAALIWFLYASTRKEAFSCTTAAKDCDSSYAYYTGGEVDRGGIGIARYIDEADAAAHDRVWDALLAVRCWRDLDPDETATDLEMRDLARDQLDRAISYGLAQVVRSRLMAMCEGDGLEALYHWTFVRTLAPALYPTLGTGRSTIEAAIAVDDPDSVDTDAFAQAIDDAYECP